MFIEGAALAADRTELEITERVGVCSPDQWENARVAIAALLGKALGNVSREWIAEQIGRSISRVGAWFELSRKAAAPPMTLMVAQRSDGDGFVLDDGELERLFVEIRTHRSRIALAARWTR